MLTAPSRRGLLVGGLAFAAMPIGRGRGAVPRESFEIMTPRNPCLLPVAGRRLLVFETHLTNLSHQRLRVMRVRISDARDGDVLADYTGAVLNDRLQKIIDDVAVGDIAPGERVVLFVEIGLTGDDAPAALAQEVEYRADDAPDAFTVNGAPVSIDFAPPSVLGPPLRGGPWVAIHQADWRRGHRRVFYTLDGRPRLPGRFAIDWVRVDRHGRIASGDPDMVANHFGYGDSVLAVADATVVSLRDDAPEPERVSNRLKNAIGDAAGNFIGLRLGDGRYAVYEHLRPGSLRISVGDRVRRGQEIASLGFTGDSTGPHLHLHVADAAMPLGGEGLPFVLDRFTRLGGYETLDGFGTRPWRPESPCLQERLWPGSHAVVQFPA